MKSPISIKRTDYTNKDFSALIRFLDMELNELHDNQRDVYDQYNAVESIPTVVVAYIDGKAVGCGCFKTYDGETVELKRMFVLKNFRGRGIARAILKELEQWAQELGNKKAILETGEKLPEAMQLYISNNYKRVQNYGQYEDLPESICFEKKI